METPYVSVLHLDITSCVIGPFEMTKSYYDNFYSKYMLPYTNFRYGYPKVEEFIISETVCTCCNQKVVKRVYPNNKKDETNN